MFSAAFSESDNPETRRVLTKPPACTEWYEEMEWCRDRSLGGGVVCVCVCVGRRSTVPGRSSSFWGKQIQDGDWECLRCKCVENNENIIFEIGANCGAGEKRDAIGVAISHVVDRKYGRPSTPVRHSIRTVFSSYRLCDWQNIPWSQLRHQRCFSSFVFQFSQNSSRYSPRASSWAT